MPNAAPERSRKKTPASADPMPNAAPKRSRKTMPASADPKAALRIGPRLSLTVVVPVYNEQHLVETSLRRVLALEDPVISKLQVVAVDDCSTDRSVEVLEHLANEDDRLRVLRHTQNSGKGAAVRTGIAAATGDVTVVHDADLEYDPRDIPALLRPFVDEGADAVFGSRYMTSPYRRALMFRHSLMNRGLTAMSNLFTDLDLSDVETCYKAVRTTLLRSIPLRSSDFRIEIELAAKLAKRRARVFEVPIRYVPRSYEEGKKIGPRDGALALAAMVRFALVDDIYQEDAYGSRILLEMERARRFNDWLADTLRPHVGNRVLEIGAGIGTLTNHFIPRIRYVASDVNPHYLHYLRAYAIGKPYLEVAEIDASDANAFRPYAEQLDTVLMSNVLEHVPDQARALAGVRSVLQPGGRLIVVVPHDPDLFGSLDEALGHRERYTRERLHAALEDAGFSVERLTDFNRFSRPGWWVNGKLLERKRFSRVQIKALDTMLPLLRRLDRHLPWGGQSLIAVARKASATS